MNYKRKKYPNRRVFILFDINQKIINKNIFRRKLK